jgi:hypothetical protein
MESLVAIEKDWSSKQIIGKGKRSMVDGRTSFFS